MLDRLNLVNTQAGLGGEGAVNIGPREGCTVPSLVWKSYLPSNTFLLSSLKWPLLYHLSQSSLLINTELSLRPNFVAAFFFFPSCLGSFRELWGNFIFYFGIDSNPMVQKLKHNEEVHWEVSFPSLPILSHPCPSFHTLIPLGPLSPRQG